MHLNDIAREAFSNSAAHGFWDDEPRDEAAKLHYFGNKLMLVVGEVSEAHEELRKPDWPVGAPYHSEVTSFADPSNPVTAQKPEGLPSELSDIIIRVADLAFRLGIDLDAAVAEKHAYNVTRPFKHGKAF